MSGLYKKSQVNRIARRFGIFPLKFKWFPSLYRKKAVIRIKTSSGHYALKPFYRNRLFKTSATQQMKKAAGHIQLLLNTGYFYMPKILYAKTGKLWTLRQGQPYYVTEWVQGRTLEHSGDYTNLGRAMAALHQSTNDGTPGYKADSPTLKQVRLWKKQHRYFLCDKSGAVQKNTMYRRWHRQYRNDCRRLSERSWAEMREKGIASLLRNERGHPRRIHGDITSANVIISGDDRLYIIDWDRVRYGSIYVEMAKTLANTTQFNLEFIQSLLAGYEEIRPLNRRERKLISALFRLPREAWLAARFPNEKKSNELIENMMNTWSGRLKANKLLDDWANRQ
ncbi:phosphotransferase [Paenibacillus jiagnxiensis]|uniref:phosphotransferase n=1 Tax=Paenibacillus jiagnxiensis TaxID=3228926 RepID=UPI0033AEE8CC